MRDIEQSFILLQKTVKFCRDTVRTLLGYATEVNSLRQKPENKPLYEANPLELLDPAEPNTSAMLECIFSYQQNGKNIILSSFTETFLSKLGFDGDAIVHPEIKAEKEHIDLWIQEKGKYSIVFENKLKGAVYQRNQLGRYIRRQIKKEYEAENTYIVLLPSHNHPSYISNIPKSTWRCPTDYMSNNSERKCCVGETKCWCDTNKKLSASQVEHCQQCTDYYPKYSQRTVVLEDDFADWLLSLIPKIDSRETILKAAITLFADYIKYLYDKRISKKLIMEITEFLRKELLRDNHKASENYNLVLETITQVEGLKQGLENLKKEVACDLIEEWYKNIKEWYENIKKDFPDLNNWPDLEYEPRNSFSMVVRGVRIGCWSGTTTDSYRNDGKPYWAFVGDCSNEGQREMVKNILAKFEIIQNVSEEGMWLSWGNTTEGEVKCKEFLKAAIEYL